MSFEIELDPKEEIIVIYKYEKNGKDFSYALTIKASLERSNSVISSSQINYENSEIKNSEIKMNASKMKSSSVVLNEQNPKDELFKLIKQKGVMRKRVWKNKVKIFHCQIFQYSFINYRKSTFWCTLACTRRELRCCIAITRKEISEKPFI